MEVKLLEDLRRYRAVCTECGRYFTHGEHDGGLCPICKVKPDGTKD